MCFCAHVRARDTVSLARCRLLGAKALASGTQAPDWRCLVAKHRLSVEPATEAHALLLAQHIRPEDAAELRASHGLEPLQGVRMALEVSPDATAVLDGCRVVAIGGAAPVKDSEGVASVWMLATRLVKRVPLAFMRVARAELARLASVWGALFNMVSAENTGALRWVGALGFEVLEPVPFGVANTPFRPILLRRR
jgi:hypothetical protein